ncbi:hypothetical protein [Blastopirellula retiformator]|uniref:Carboxypeptidase regulatory-like domain-containing protein n=1 Tax=Blastopirellula retiformator TaxID=2527970 RepID=A0A5C5UUU9_9BACT|nr:hypothetical protein [Blastopirellula retiformator]TWT29262.1 hypothetical protein Enr8_50630 [Blastopirellula retiformator]
MNRIKRAVAVACFGATTALLLSGCSRGPQKFDISGTVTVDGMPVEKATIMFAPVVGTADQIATGRIENGAYAVESLPGEKYVRFAGLAGNEKPIPFHYISGSEITANVTEDATDVNFELTRSTRRRR